MSNIEKITRKITADAENYSAEVKKNADTQAEQVLADATARAEKAYGDIISKGEKERDAVIARAVSSADILERNILLDAKSTLTEKAFEKALDALCELDEARYADFLVRKLTEAINAIGDAEDDGYEYDVKDPDLYVVTLNGADAEKYGKMLTDKLSGVVKAKKCRLAFSDSCADIKGGFLLRRGEIEINASFETLVENAKERATADVCSALFYSPKGEE